MASFIKKRLLLIITNSFAATNLIHSGLIKDLAVSYEIYIISNLIHNKQIEEINTHFDIRICKINIKIPVESKLIKILRLLEKAMFFYLFKIETQKIKIKQKGFWFQFTTDATLGLINFLGVTHILLKFLRSKIIHRTENNPLLDQLVPYQFDGVISSSPLDIQENSIVNFLKKYKVPSLAMVISWDNLTSKGIMNADHDYVLVWNTLMKEEFIRFYSMFYASEQHIYPTGIPRFDIYFNKIENNYSKDKFYDKYKFYANDKIILFATSSIAHFPNQVDILKHLLEYISHNPHIKIIVRCHPSDNSELYKQFADQSHLRIWHQNNAKNKHLNYSVMPDLNVLDSLYEMLKYCNVCINVASTIKLEAAICNKPSISIAYDGNRTVPFHQSVRRFYRYTHQIPLNAIKIDKMVFNKQELFGSLDEILYKSFDKPVDYRHKIQKFVQHSGPFARSSTMKYIRQWLN